MLSDSRNTTATANCLSTTPSDRTSDDPYTSHDSDAAASSARWHDLTAQIFGRRPTTHEGATS